MPTINVPYEGGTLRARIVSDPTPPVMTTSTDADWITGTGTTTTATTSLVVAANATYYTRTATVTVSGITQEDPAYRGRASASSAWTISQAAAPEPAVTYTISARFSNQITAGSVFSLTISELSGSTVATLSWPVSSGSTNTESKTYQAYASKKYVYELSCSDYPATLSFNHFANTCTSSPYSPVASIGVSPGDYDVQGEVCGSQPEPDPPTPSTSSATLSIENHVVGPSGRNLTISWGNITIGNFPNGGSNVFDYPTSTSDTDTATLTISGYDDGGVTVLIEDSNHTEIMSSTIGNLTGTSVQFKCVKNATWYLS